MKTTLTIRWERGEECAESSWEREDDGLLYTAYVAILNLIDVLSKLGKAREKK